MENKKETMYEFTYMGRIVKIGPVQTFSSGFKKRELVIDKSATNSKYPNPVAFSLTKDDVDKGDALKVGQTVTVRGFINGRSWNNPKDGTTRFFNDLVIFGKIEVEGGADIDDDAKAAANLAEADGDDNDMPF